MSFDAVFVRLEAVAQRLEAFESRIGRAGPIGGSAASTSTAATADSVNDAPTSSHPSVLAYVSFFNEYVQPFLNTCQEIGGEISKIGELAEKGFRFGITAAEAAIVSSKPTNDVLLGFVEPISEVIQEVNAIKDNRSKAFNHQSGFAEAIQALQWILVTPTPQAFVQGALESSDFYLNKVLASSKDTDNKEAHRNFVKQLRAALSELKAYIKAHHATGLTWNPSGAPLSSFKQSSSAAVPSAPVAPAAPPAPPAPPSAPNTVASSAAPAASGMSAVFSQINAGHAALTSGLRKVTDDMKTKNRSKEDRVSSVPNNIGCAKRVLKKPATATKKPASKTLSQGKWFVEYFSNAGVVKLDDVQLNQTVYIYKCDNCTIQITSKIKAICMDSCKKVKVVFDTVVSTVEVVNCQSVEVAATGTAPSIAVDKTAGCQLWLSDQCVRSDPSIVTSNISEVNIRLPGKTDEDDWPELSIPEQFVTRVTGERGSRSVETQHVTHG